MAIKDIIVFFVESAIMLIPAITEAILALARGDIGGVAKAIEFGLAKLIALVIGLFARLIGLGGLADKVKKIFKKIRKRVDTAIKKLLKKAKAAGRKIMRKLGLGKDKPKNKEQHDQQVKAGMTYLHQQEKALDKDGNKAITLEQAQDVAKKTKKKFKVFTSIKPVEKGGKWSYKWTGSTGVEDSKVKVEGEAEGNLLVGAHPLSGKGRESHHVPANKLAKTIGDFYGKVGTKLPSNDSFSALRKVLLKRQEDIENTYGESGKGLSAILIDEGTHRTADNAVHGIIIQPEVLNEIESNANGAAVGKTAVVVIATTGEKRTIANLNSSHWQSFLQQIYQIEKSKLSGNTDERLLVNATEDKAVITIKGGNKKGNEEVADDITKKAKSLSNSDTASEEVKSIKAIINNTSENTFDKALDNGIAAVKTALKDSTKDGDKKDHAGALAKTRKLAVKIWSKLVLKKF